MGSIASRLNDAGHAHRILGHPSLFNVVFTDAPVRDYRDVLKGDKQKQAQFDDALRRNGVFKSSGKTYISMALTDADLALTDEAVAAAVKTLNG